MDQRELLRLRAEANHATTLVSHAEASLSGAERKLKKAKADLAGAEESLENAKAELEAAQKDAEEKAELCEGHDSFAFAQAAEIKAVK